MLKLLSVQEGDAVLSECTSAVNIPDAFWDVNRRPLVCAYKQYESFCKRLVYVRTEVFPGIRTSAVPTDTHTCLVRMLPPECGPVHRDWSQPLLVLPTDRPVEAGKRPTLKQDFTWWLEPEDKARLLLVMLFRPEVGIHNINPLNIDRLPDHVRELIFSFPIKAFVIPRLDQCYHPIDYVANQALSLFELHRFAKWKWEADKVKLVVPVAPQVNDTADAKFLTSIPVMCTAYIYLIWLFQFNEFPQECWRGAWAQFVRLLRGKPLVASHPFRKDLQSGWTEQFSSDAVVLEQASGAFLRFLARVKSRRLHENRTEPGAEGTTHCAFLRDLWTRTFWVQAIWDSKRWSRWAHFSTHHWIFRPVTATSRLCVMAQLGSSYNYIAQYAFKQATGDSCFLVEGTDIADWQRSRLSLGLPCMDLLVRDEHGEIIWPAMQLWDRKQHRHNVALLQGAAFFSPSDLLLHNVTACLRWMLCKAPMPPTEDLSICPLSPFMWRYASDPKWKQAWLLYLRVVWPYLRDKDDKQVLRVYHWLQPDQPFMQWLARNFAKAPLPLYVFLVPQIWMRAPVATVSSKQRPLGLKSMHLTLDAGFATHTIDSVLSNDPLVERCPTIFGAWNPPRDTDNPPALCPRASSLADTPSSWPACVGRPHVLESKTPLHVQRFWFHLELLARGSPPPGATDDMHWDLYDTPLARIKERWIWPEQWVAVAQSHHDSALWTDGMVDLFNSTEFPMNEILHQSELADQKDTGVEVMDFEAELHGRDNYSLHREASGTYSPSFPSMNGSYSSQSQLQLQSQSSKRQRLF
jgi:hypothetical protein